MAVNAHRRWFFADVGDKEVIHIFPFNLTTSLRNFNCFRAATSWPRDLFCMGQSDPRLLCNLSVQTGST